MHLHRLRVNQTIEGYRVMKKSNNTNKANAVKANNGTNMSYADMLETARRLIKDGLTVKDAVHGVRYSTASYAVEFCRTFKSWDAYKALFAHLKEDLKAEGVKFAGTPLAKGCLAVATAVIDCHLTIEGQTIEDRLTFTRSAFKDAGVCFSSKQADIRLGFGCPTKSDKQAAEEAAFGDLRKHIEEIQKMGGDAVTEAIQTLNAWIERENKVAATAERIAKEGKAA